MNAPNPNGLPTQSRACPIVSAHQECQFAERITRSCALRSNCRTMLPIEFAIGNGASVRLVFLNYRSRKHQHQQSHSRPHVFTPLLDNVRVHRAAAHSLNIETRATRGSVCNPLLSGGYDSVSTSGLSFTGDSVCDDWSIFSRVLPLVQIKSYIRTRRNFTPGFAR